jgi:preprotein translocase subunit SecE
VELIADELPAELAEAEDDAEDETEFADGDPDDEEPGDGGEGETIELTAAEQVAQTVASVRPVRKAGKGSPTAKQAKAKPKARKERTTPAKFVNESVGELKKVIWPTFSQWQQYFIVVLVFVVIIIAYVTLLDLGFGAGLLWLFGGNGS